MRTAFNLRIVIRSGTRGTRKKGKQQYYGLGVEAERKSLGKVVTRKPCDVKRKAAGNPAETANNVSGHT